MSYMIYLERVSQLIFKTLMPKQKKNNRVLIPWLCLSTVLGRCTAINNIYIEYSLLYSNNNLG